MADRRRPRRAPKRTLIGPLVILASGAAAGMALWRFLMLEPAPGGLGVRAVEQLSQHDRQALEQLFERDSDQH